MPRSIGKGVVLGSVITVLLVFTVLNCFASNLKENSCDLPYSLPIGSTVDKMTRTLEANGIKYTQRTATELKQGVMTASNLVVPDGAVIGLTYVQTTTTSYIVGTEKTCVTIMWFDLNRDIVGLSRFIRRTWL